MGSERDWYFILSQKITLTLKDGNKFTIKAKGNRKKNVYISSVKTHWKAYFKNFIRYF
ncbi:glycoside hydrolase domain-containing protein [Pricia antarctica]|uniref:glycoside hydrolase domain-containing protein n=1 Tax=Pricia antarctica TaxID=641691 RepID=UPI00373FE09A